MRAQAERTSAEASQDCAAVLTAAGDIRVMQR